MKRTFAPMPPGIALFVPLAVFVSIAAAAPQVVTTPILRTGDPYPGRPGDVVSRFEDFGTSLHPRDASGRVSFIANRASSAISDLLTYDPATHATTALAPTGLTTAEGFVVDQFWDAQSRNAPGQTLSFGLIRDVPSGSITLSLLLTSPAGAVSAIAAPIAPVPNQPGASFETIYFGNSGLSGLQAVLNDRGTAAFQAAFRQGTSPRQMGMYAWRPDTGLTRIIDSTQPVPGHPTAQWVSYTPGSPDQTPFETDNLQLTGSDQAVFRAKFTMAGTLSRALFRGSPASGFTAIVDPARGDQVPGRAPGTGFFNIPAFAAASNGDVIFEGISTGTFNRGVYRQKPGHPVEKLHDNTDPVPGGPTSGVQIIISLESMNNRGDAALRSLFTVDPDQIFADFIRHDNGAKQLIYRSDDVPFAPAGAKGTTGVTLLNDLGDTLSLVELNTRDPAGIYNAHVAFARLGSGELIRALATGDTLDGMRVLDFNIFRSLSDGGHGVDFTDDRRFTVMAHLAGPDGLPLTADDVNGLYDLQVIPTPGALSALTLAGLAGCTRARDTGARDTRARDTRARDRRSGRSRST